MLSIYIISAILCLVSFICEIIQYDWHHLTLWEFKLYLISSILGYGVYLNVNNFFHVFFIYFVNVCLSCLLHFLLSKFILCFDMLNVIFILWWKRFRILMGSNENNNKWLQNLNYTCIRRLALTYYRNLGILL